MIGIALAVSVAGCGFVHDEKLTGPYHLIAVDVPEEMGICYAIEENACIGRITDTVFSVGWDERYIVAKQHPSNNRAITNYFILEMARDSELADPGASVTGPLSAVAFQEKSIALGLPKFTKTIGSLK